MGAPLPDSALLAEATLFANEPYLLELTKEGRIIVKYLEQAPGSEESDSAAAASIANLKQR